MQLPVVTSSQLNKCRAWGHNNFVCSLS